MAKKVTIGGGKKIQEVLAVEIGEKTYSVPLSGSMKRKEILALDNEDAVYDMFAKHIPAEVLDNLTMDEYKQLAYAWIDANNESQGATLGES